MANHVLRFPFLRKRNPNEHNMKYFSGLALVAGLCIIFLSTLSSQKSQQTEKTDHEKSENSINSFQQVQAVPIPGYVTFADEEVPIHEDDVRERLDRELLVNSYWHSSTIQLIKLSSRYFPDIERVLAEEGVPDDFKYLAAAESGLRNVVSGKSAKGIWQFRKGASRDFGLFVNDEVDERYHLERSTRAACKYLKKAKARFGTWRNAAAAYNMGSANLNKNLTNQKETDLLALNINDETSRYYFRLIAMKEILSNPSNYGFQINEHEKYAPLTNYTPHETSSSITNLADFAHEHGTTYRKLKVYNPWLRRHYLKNKERRKYTIRVPN